MMYSVKGEISNGIGTQSEVKWQKLKLKKSNEAIFNINFFL